MDFSTLKKNRDKAAQNLTAKVEKLNSKADYTDKRFWKLKAGKDGNAQATIRFLDAPKDEDFPFVRYFLHQFKGAGGWLWQNCLTSIGKDCPVCKANSILWNTEIKENQNIVRDRKRKLKYISNILVIKDPKDPENNGKVFLFEYGQKIFDKINELLNPIVDGETTINPFDFWTGANFTLVQVKGEGGYPNYDKSKFANPAKISDDDAKIEAIWKQEYSLKEFEDAKNFLDEAELKAKFEKAIGNVGSGVSQTAEQMDTAKAKTSRTRTRKEEVSSDETVNDTTVSDDETPPWDTPAESSEDHNSLLEQFVTLANGE